MFIPSSPSSISRTGVSMANKFYAHRYRIETRSNNNVWVLLGFSIQGQIKYFKEVTIYFLRWEYTFGYDWEA
jgi:hypothetical protein